jgi:hypothetical protein
MGPRQEPLLPSREFGKIRVNGIVKKWLTTIKGNVVIIEAPKWVIKAN